MVLSHYLNIRYRVVPQFVKKLFCVVFPKSYLILSVSKLMFFNNQNILYVTLPTRYSSIFISLFLLIIKDIFIKVLYIVIIRLKVKVINILWKIYYRKRSDFWVVKMTAWCLIADVGGHLVSQEILVKLFFLHISGKMIFHGFYGFFEKWKAFRNKMFHRRYLRLENIYVYKFLGI